MGILVDDLQWLLNNVQTNSSMLELGNQFIYIFSQPWPSYPVQFVTNGTDMVVAKPYFETLGFTHTSVDLNGLDGALVKDLSKPFDLDNRFDIVTDFGTSEHVPSLYNCLLNIHNHLKVGGSIFHVNPLTNNWPGHGYWYRDEDFYTAYSKLVGYKMTDLHQVVACGNFVDGRNICAKLTKTFTSKFPTEEEFNKLPIKTK